MDFGLIKIEKGLAEINRTISGVDAYIKECNNKINEINKSNFPNLNYFVFIPDKILDRSKINDLIGLDIYGNYKPVITDLQKCLRGKLANNDTPGKSKKVFSFIKERTWIYTDAKDELKKDLQTELLKIFKIDEMINGEQIIIKGFNNEL